MRGRPPTRRKDDSLARARVAHTPFESLSEGIPNFQARKELEVAILRQQLVDAVSEAKGCNSCVVDYRTTNSRPIDDRLQVAEKAIRLR